MAKASSGWYSSTFGGFATSVALSEKPNLVSKDKRKRKVHADAKLPAGSTPWVDKYCPKDKDNLAVHKRKVEQVEEWIKLALTSLHKRNGKCPLLLLTGPTGCGKTATVHILAAQLGLLVCEWKNSTQYIAYRGHHLDNEDVFEEKQIPSFKSFLLRASRYSSLLNDQTSDRLVLVEDFPNVCFREPESLHSVLREYSHTGQSLTVFIVSDSSRREMSVTKLFPKDLTRDLDIHEISFNPLTALTISRVFQKILAAEKSIVGNQISSLSKLELDSLAEAAVGDIRSAINSLQFAASCSSQSRKVVKKVKSSDKFKKPSQVPENSSAVGRDSTLVLFHALGKVLYSKRDATKHETTLPKHLEKHNRLRLKEVPEEIVERSGTSGEQFSLFLHQNYLEFFHDIDHVSEAISYMSAGDCLHPRFEDKSCENEYGSSVGVRGLMFHLGNTSDKSNSTRGRWMPLRKPAWYNTNRTLQKNLMASREEFKESLMRIGQELYISSIPYTCRISCSALTPGQKQLVLLLSKFSRRNESSAPMFSEGLDVEEEDNNSLTCTYINNNKSNEIPVVAYDDNEDNVNIEEFSD